MSSPVQPILTDAETMEMLTAFYSEALRFLSVPEEQWAEVKMGVAFDPTDGKASIITVNYTKQKILVCLPVLKQIMRLNPKFTGDTPSAYRSYGYKLGRLWQQYLKTGEQRIFEQDKDSDDFANALGIIKGLPQIDVPVGEDVIKLFGHNPFDRQAAILMLRDEFGIDCKAVQAYDQVNKEKRTVVTLTDEAQQRRAAELNKLYEDSVRIPLPKIAEGQLGSRNNPFQNVDVAAEYILQIEKERLAADTYRQAINKEQCLWSQSLHRKSCNK